MNYSLSTGVKMLNQHKCCYIKLKLDFSVLNGTGLHKQFCMHAIWFLVLRFLRLCCVERVQHSVRLSFDMASRRWVKKGLIPGLGSFDLQPSH